MGVVSYQEYLFYVDIVKYLFLAIGLTAFLFYNFNRKYIPLSKGIILFLFVLIIIL